MARAILILILAGCAKEGDPIVINVERDACIFQTAELVCGELGVKILKITEDGRALFKCWNSPKKIKEIIGCE